MVNEEPELEIIAELANAHEGREADLLQLIRLSAAAGVDAVKVQLVLADELCTPDYQHFETFRRQELPEAVWQRAAQAAGEAGCRLYLDVFGPNSAAVAERIGADGIKLHASDTANDALIRTVANSAVARVLVAAGGATVEELRAVLVALDGKQVVLMHGFQGYPTLLADNQIRRIAALRQIFADVRIGFAEHVPFTDPARFWLSSVAIGAGATVLEKHVTLATVTRGLDHDAALNPDELARFVTNMRAAALALGSVDSGQPDFGMADAERRYRSNARKALVATRDLSAGHVLGRDDLALKRSGHPAAVALHPGSVLGRSLGAAVRQNEPIHEGVLS